MNKLKQQQVFRQSDITSMVSYYYCQDGFIMKTSDHKSQTQQERRLTKTTLRLPPFVFQLSHKSI